ncbi:MAG: carbohydrate binding family 9 domain-containing protein [Acidobacteria bacterium]|nr:carbohydrate binding family 9 domain-containing protein [Acidobacteriota bacterium]
MRWARLILLPFLLPEPLLSSQETPHHPQPLHPSKILLAVRTALPITLDGDLSEAAWKDAPLADDFVQAEPYEREPATENTRVRVVYDDHSLYIGVYCYDQDPQKIMVNSLKEDFGPADTDSFEVVLDTFKDGRNGYLFVINPQGAKRDAQITNEGRTVNADWDTVWDVRAQRNGEGWMAEIVIPFKSLSFDENRKEQMWGINFSRRIRRKNEQDFWAPVPRRYDISRVSLAGELRGLEGVRRGRNLKVKPFVLADVSRLARSPSPRVNFDGGLDAKYSITPSLTLDLTSHTDFSQVEVDEQQINLTRFPLFFPEKREFFLENAGIFQFGDIPLERGPDRSRETQLFFSRRIGLSEEGEPIPILGGARLSGHVGKFSLGLLNMQTKRGGDHFPGNNFTVLRLKRDLFANSDVGAVWIHRGASGGKDFHRTAGADANFRFWQNLTVNAFLAQTQADGVSDADRAHKVSAQWRDNFLRFQLIYADIQENFKPEVGFVQRTGVRSIRHRFELHPRPPKNPVLREFHPHLLITYFMDQSNRTLTKEVHIHGEILFHNGGRLELQYNPQFERLDHPFRIRPHLLLPVGDYRFRPWTLEADTDKSKKLFGTLEFRKGEFYSGKLTTVLTAGTFRPNDRFSLEGRYTLNEARLLQGSFTTRLLSLRINYSFSTRMFLNGLFQYNSDRRQVSSNIRFNFIHRPLSDLFMVYNEQRDVSGAGRTDKALIVKYTHLLAF